MDKNLTDNEIVKALECAIRNDCDCNCVFLLPNKVQDVLNLINRLQAEKWKLQKEISDLKNGYFQKRYEENEHLELMGLRKGYSDAAKMRDYFQLKAMNLEEDIKTTKAEAYKECIEKVKREINSQSHSRSLEASRERFRIYKILDNLLKELEGDSK